MKRIVVFVAILLFAVNAFANTFPKVSIQSGENVVSVKIKNETDIDIHKLKLTFDKTKLPQGIKISKNSGQIDVKAKTLNKKSFRLKITASEQIKPGTFVIPFSLKDRSGHSWSFKLDAIVNKPNQYELLQNYPNPFNGQTKITYSLAPLPLS
ncbi:MAG: hypothetical protein GWP06_18500 [Actinobacteria bacterium]|nr:hypothetical protein [Actinomycetota bacterium]